jgi:DNA (cytosine-5)-methyltransferase 1
MVAYSQYDEGMAMIRNSERKPLVGDLFSGAGGLSLGASIAGADVLFGCDDWEAAAQTYQASHPRAEFFPCPIEELDPKMIMRSVGIRRGELDILLGGPPCQGFSINAPVRHHRDKRNLLVREYIRLARGLLPKYLVIENVPGLLSFGDGGVLRWIYEGLGALGYSVKHRVLLAARYGVPQERWRLIVIARRWDMPEVGFAPASNRVAARANFTGGAVWTREVPLFSAHALPRLDPVTVKEAIGDLPRLKNGEGTERRPMPHADWSRLSAYQQWVRGGAVELWNHVAPKLGEINLRRLQHIPPGGNWRDVPRRMLPPGMRRAEKGDHTKRYGRLSPTGLSGTILTDCDPHWGSFFHYSQDRAITPREAARLQSFPDTYVFAGTPTAQYRQIGNAVPPLFARAIVSPIVQALQQAGTQRNSRATQAVLSPRVARR